MIVIVRAMDRQPSDAEVFPLQNIAEHFRSKELGIKSSEKNGNLLMGEQWKNVPTKGMMAYAHK